MPGLARALMQAGRLSRRRPTRCKKRPRRQDRPSSTPCWASGAIDARSLAAFCAETFGYPLIDLSTFNIDALPANAIDAKLMQAQRVIALAKRGNKMSVALSDPTNIPGAGPDQVPERSLGRAHDRAHDALLALLAGWQQERRAEHQRPGRRRRRHRVRRGRRCRGRQAAAAEAGANEVEDAPIVRFLNKMLMDAINLGASDIHFEPLRKVLPHPPARGRRAARPPQPPLSIREKLVSRIKVLAKLDISEKRVPQDGRMRLVLSPTKTIDFRVSTLPTLFGEKTVMRILDATQAQMGIDALGYDPDQKECCSTPSSVPTAWCW
jgi:type IV pilus assembly protein PilB